MTNKFFVYEAICISIYVLILALGKIGIDYFGMIVMFAYIATVASFVFLNIKAKNFKSNLLLTIVDVYYKCLILTSLLFAFYQYPGKDYLFGATLISAVILVVIALIKKNNTNLALSTIVYANIFAAISFAFNLSFYQ